MGDLGLIPGLGRFPGGGHGNSLQYSCLENPHGQRSLVGYSPWGHKESDMTERLSTAHTADAESPSRWKKLTVCCPQAGNLRMVGIRRLTIKTPPNSHLDTSPPANEKDIKERIIHPVTRSLTLLLKTLS